MINLSGYLLQVLMIFHFESFSHRIGEASNTLEMTVLFLHNVYDKRFSLTKWLAEIKVTLVSQFFSEICFLVRFSFLFLRT